MERAERGLYALRMMSWIIDPRFYRANRHCHITRPVFLLGTQGGGLTLLSRMLHRHPSVVGPAGGSNYWSAADELQNVYGPVLPAALTGLRYKAPSHEILTAPRSWTFAARDLLPHYRKTPEDATAELKQSLERVIRYSVSRFGGADQTIRFVDKSQSFSVRVGLIWALLKEYCPHFILVPREPYVSVYRAATGKAGDMRRLQDTISYKERIDICAEHYANTMRATLEDADSLSLPLKVVRFEDLIENPEVELRGVCDFVGLDFREDLLPAAHHRLPLGSRFRDRWYPIRKNVNDRYERDIDAWTIERVNHHGEDIVRRLGYDVR